MDLWAKFWVLQVEGKKYFQYQTPKGIWKISMHGIRVCKDLLKHLTDSIEGGKAADYWIHIRRRTSEEGSFEIGWVVNERTMKSVSQARRHFVTKFESGMCATGKMMKI